MSYSVELIDVSKWQDDNSTPQQMNFLKAREKGVKGVFIKASERMFMDGDYMYNWKAAQDAGLKVGAYHFLRWDISGLYQADFFCNDVLKGDWGDLPLVADFEAPKLVTSSKTYYPSNALLYQFLMEVKRITGKTPMIYTSNGFWNTSGSRDSKWLNFPLWIAHYTKAAEPTIPAPWSAWAFWQHGVYPVGIEYGAESEGLDLDWYNGTETEFNEEFGGSTIPVPPPNGKELDIDKLNDLVDVAIKGWTLSPYKE
jgi:lysozyme